MIKKQISTSQLKQAIEMQAYAYGVSHTTCILLSESIINLLKNTYGQTNKQLVQKTIK